MTINQFARMAFKRWAMEILSLSGEVKTKRIIEFESWKNTWKPHDRIFKTTPFAICEKYRNQTAQQNLF